MSLTNLISRLSSMSISTRGAAWYPQPMDELSRHRTRPPSFGIGNRTRVRVVDNSKAGKEAMISARPPFCIHVYKPKSMGHKRHMPKAETGDKILVGVLGEMRRAYVVGSKYSHVVMSHGKPSFDSNNVVLLDNNGNPLGNRILVPIPSWLRQKRTGDFAKILAIATKFI